MSDDVATRERRHDAPDLVAHHLRGYVGDGSMGWVCQPIQAPVLADAAELLDEIWDEYIAWCKTDEGMSYLKGGANYKEAS